MSYTCTQPHAGVICPHHGKVDIDYREYSYQINLPKVKWTCPICREISEFDDDRYEEIHFIHIDEM